jgi:PPOX class probable F420-dependent enzyme
MTTLERFTDQWAVLLTTFRRDGTPVGTPVSIAVDGDRAYVRSPGNAWKVKRIRNNPDVRIAPSTFRGRPTGPEIAAVARRVEGEEAVRAARLLRRKHPILQGVLVPLAHKLMRCGTAYFEIRARDGVRPLPGTDPGPEGPAARAATRETGSDPVKRG